MAFFSFMFETNLADAALGNALGHTLGMAFGNCFGIFFWDFFWNFFRDVVGDVDGDFCGMFCGNLFVTSFVILCCFNYFKNNFINTTNIYRVIFYCIKDSDFREHINKVSNKIELIKLYSALELMLGRMFAFLHALALLVTVTDCVQLYMFRRQRGGRICSWLPKRKRSRSRSIRFRELLQDTQKL